MVEKLEVRVDAVADLAQVDLLLLLLLLWGLEVW